jgi:hypothetical protein
MHTVQWLNEFQCTEQWACLLLELSLDSSLVELGLRLTGQPPLLHGSGEVLVATCCYWVLLTALTREHSQFLPAI